MKHAPPSRGNYFRVQDLAPGLKGAQRLRICSLGCVRCAATECCKPRCKAMYDHRTVTPLLCTFASLCITRKGVRDLPMCIRMRIGDIYIYIYTCMHARMHTYIQPSMPAYIHTHLPPSLPPSLPTYVQTDMHTYKHPSVHTYTHAYMHTCIHVHRYLYTYKNTHDNDRCIRVNVLCLL